MQVNSQYPNEHCVDVDPVNNQDHDRKYTKLMNRAGRKERNSPKQRIVGHDLNRVGCSRFAEANSNAFLHRQRDPCINNIFNLIAYFQHSKKACGC